MLQVQSRLGYGVEWFDIQHDKKQWIAWYIDQDDITLLNVEEKLDTSAG